MSTWSISVEMNCIMKRLALNAVTRSIRRTVSKERVTTMKKRVAVVVYILALVIAMTACAYSDVEKAYDEDSDEQIVSMFVEVETNLYFRVFYHRDTKVMYAVSDSSYNRGNFTVLVNPDGSPMLYEGE